MKPYIAMCSLCLAVGAGLGHGYGKHTTAVHFADACDQGSFVELQIGDTEASRNYHCFEIKPTEHREAPVEQKSVIVPMI